MVSAEMRGVPTLARIGVVSSAAALALFCGRELLGIYMRGKEPVELGSDLAPMSTAEGLLDLLELLCGLAVPLLVLVGLATAIVTLALDPSRRKLAVAVLAMGAAAGLWWVIWLASTLSHFH